MEEVKQQNTYLAFFQRHKYHLFIGFALLIVIAVAIAMISIILDRSTKQPEPTPTVSPIPSQTLPTSIQQQSQTVTISPPETNIIQTQTKPQLDTIITIPYTITGTKTYGQEWAMLQVSSSGTDPAMVVAHKVNGDWKVVLGPGTYFDAESLQAVGAPTDLANDINKPF
jgi:hypothetical protein